MTSFCWCGTRAVIVTRQMVLDGETVSCGPRCSPETAAAPTVDVAMSRAEWVKWWKQPFYLRGR